MTEDEVFLCIGICLPDADEAYCIGCGRPWGTPVQQIAEKPGSVPTSTDDEQPRAS
jgi:hypothetical protein